MNKRRDMGGAFCQVADEIWQSMQYSNAVGSALIKWLVVLTLVFAQAAAALAFDQESLYVPSSGAVISTSQLLQADKQYVIVVTGLWSAWPQADYTGCGMICGSPIIVNGLYLGVDAEFVFGTPWCGGSCNTPYHFSNFIMNYHGVWEHVEPAAGSPGSPDVAHCYTYVLSGNDQYCQFKISDSVYWDNRGGLSIVINEISSTGSPDAPSPVGVALMVIPNPFNPRTTLRFDLPVAGRVHLEVYDVAGRLIRTLLDADLPAGSHQAVWDGKDERGMGVASGSYFARLSAGGKVETVRMGLIR